jgi:acyl carrier protein
MHRLKELLAEILMVDFESVPSSSTPLRDMEGWDSLKHVMLVLGLEERFAVKLSAEEIKAMIAVEDIERVLREKGADG